MADITFAKPLLGTREIDALKEVIQSGWIVQGNKISEFESSIGNWVGSPFACAVSNCTNALQLALLAAGVLPGDVVITVSYSFIATANAIRLCFAEPYFVDIDSGSLNMSASALDQCLQNNFHNIDGALWLRDPDQLAINPSVLSYCREPFGRLAAILVVHQAGVPADLNLIMPVAEKFGIPVIEDAACALGSEISFDNGATWEKIGKPHGDAACFSFHPRKIITTGEGGMITSGTSDLNNRFKILRNHGTSVTTWGRDNADEILQESYTETGFNFKMTDIQAAVGLAQMTRLGDVISKRREISGWYEEHLASSKRILTPSAPSNMRVNHQSYICRLSDPKILDPLMQKLKSSGVYTRTGILNIHHQSPYVRIWRDISFSNSEKAQIDRIMLPMHPELTRNDIHKIVRLIEEF